MSIERYKNYTRIAEVLGQSYYPSLNRMDFEYIGEEKFHVVASHEIGNLPIVSYSHYNTPLLWWVIAMHNKVRHPLLEVPVGKVLRIPVEIHLIDRGITFR